MKARTEARVEGWETRPFEDGYDGLRSLADREFSGVVRSGGAWLFMLNGRVVGVHQGTIEDFEGASGTAHLAPDPSLPLLFSMQEQGGTVQAKYYTNDTPISEAVETLTDANFTGYIELSENVLSGDYYVVFYGGRSMNAAFVGNKEKLLTGDEAFNRADDEVGIYKVMKVDVEVDDVPEPAAASAGAGAGVGAGAGAGADAGEGADTEGGADAGEGAVAGGAAVDAAADEDTAPDDVPDPVNDPLSPAEDVEGASGGAEEFEQSGDADEAGADEPTGEPDEPVPGSEEPTEPTPGETTGAPGDSSDAAAADAGADAAPSTADQDLTTSDPEASAADAVAAQEAAAEAEAAVAEEAGGADPAATGGAASGPAGEREWQETRHIPSIDPSRSTSPSGASTGASAAGAGSTSGTSAPSTTGGVDQPDRSPSTEPATGRGTDSDSSSTGGTGAEPATGTTDPVEEAVNSQRVAELEGELEDREAQINRLERKLTDVQVERDSLAEERSKLKAEIGQLEDEIDELEARVAQLQDSVEGEAAVGQQLDPETALDRTNLFVRYGTKSGGTLAKAHAGEVDKDEVNNNLRLEHHTQFDEATTNVDGQAFDEFLSGTMSFRFVRWVVQELLYEIRGTGHQKGLKSLYDALPRIDRAELNGSVSVRYTKEGEEYREQQSFDVVLRDRMGNPLLVANLNDSRSPATEEMMVSLVEDSTKVKRTSDALSGALLVTASFFEPQALEEADEATSGGFLGRDTRDAFVKLSRKQGYHLCLVESRGGEFHLTMPEL